MSSQGRPTCLSDHLADMRARVKLRRASARSAAETSNAAGFSATSLEKVGRCALAAEEEDAAAWRWRVAERGVIGVMDAAMLSFANDLEVLAATPGDGAYACT